MSDLIAAEDPAPLPAITLPCPLPVRYPTEPRELTEYRKQTGDAVQFKKLRRAFREAEDWRALATLLVLHAAAIESDPRQQPKAAELCIQAYELLLERVKDRQAAAHALARAVQLKPENVRAQQRLQKLYEAQGAYEELIALLRWRLRTTPGDSAAASLHLELAELLDNHFVAIGEAVQHFEQAWALSPGDKAAANRLIQLYLSAGAWHRASELITSMLEHIDPSQEPQRVAELHRRLAAIESEQMHNVAAAARNLQAALKAVPDDIEALRAFGVLYLSSGKATQDGVQKAADIFYKAAEIARRRGDRPRALKLLRRCLNLMPDHQQASAALENTLIDAEDWLALDELYREWLFHFSGPDAVPLLLRRAELLDRRLHRREEARQLYEEVSRYQRPTDEGWQRLEQIYTDSGDFHALASLLDAQVERVPDEVPTETLLRAASVYREQLGLEERAAVYYYKVLEREPFNPIAFEGYKEHWRRKHNWSHLRDLLLYQIEQAVSSQDADSPLADPEFAEEFVELAEICERRLGDIDGALEAWNRLAEFYPADTRPHKHVARIEKRARMWDNMVRVQEAELERAVDPAKRLDILKRLTQVYRDRQVNPDRAIELYNEILQLSPNDIQATRALTALYDRSGDYPHVVEMLREQYERSRSNTERIALLRRMAELWHHELEAAEEAIWACEQILTLASADKEAMVRLQQLLEEQERWEELYDTLERELKMTASVDAKMKIYRRIARLCERELGDDDRAVKVWNQLLSLKPANLEIVDRLITLFERAGRYEEMATLLSKAADASTTPMVRQVDYLLRLGQLAEAHIDDPQLARSSFETVLRSRPDHRGALEALVRIYRGTESWKPLVAVLGKLQELAETDEDAFRIAWERHELLADQLGEPEAAAEILEQLLEGAALGRREVASSLLELYERSGQHRKVVRQAEVLLLATEGPEDRRRLYETISNTWLRELKDKHAALATYARYVDEFSGDLDALQTMANLQLEVGEPEAALGTLQRRLELTADTSVRTSTLEQMSEVAEVKRGDGRRALAYLREALRYDHFADNIIERARAVGKRHGLWDDLLGLHEDRFMYHQEAGDADGQVDVCREAAEVAETESGDAERAFAWARRGYDVALTYDLDGRSLLDRLERLAEEHGMWSQLLEVIEREVEIATHSGAMEDGRYDAIARFLHASEIAEDRLEDGAMAVAYLQRAHRLQPHDEDLSQRLENTAERYADWQAVIELQGGRLDRAVTDLGRYDACVAIAKVFEEKLDDPDKAFEWLQKASLDLASSDPKLSKDAFELLLALCQRHNLWPPLVQHHLDRATEAADSDPERHLDALRAAAEVYHREMNDPLAAIRTLLAGLASDPSGAIVLPLIRELSLEVDEKRHGSLPAIGALALLDTLQRLCERSEAVYEKRAWIEERAKIRENRLESPATAMAEWYRALSLEVETEQALVEMERLANDHDLWHLYLIHPASQLEQTGGPATEPDVRDEQVRLYKELARLYEGPLERPEYALRARLLALRLDPDLPPLHGELDSEHAAIWRLAEQTGTYDTPPIPRDVVLTPALDVPEVADLAAWARCGLEPGILETIPSPASPRLELAAPAAVPNAAIDEVSLTAYATEVTSDSDPPVRTGTTEEIEVIEELDFEELELIEEIDDDADEGERTIPRDSAGAPIMGGHDTRTRGLEVSAPQPPPPPRAPDAGLPSLPRLHRPILPGRPKLASAWEEVALAYADAPTANKREKADLALVLARLWEEGAQDLERAFEAHEQALLWVPEYDEALQSLEALAERHAASDRLQQAYDRLLGEATMPDHLIPMGLRLARLHEQRDESSEAEERYRGVLAVDPTHIEALQALCRIYESEERYEEYTRTFSTLLEAEFADLDDDARIERTLELARLLSERLNRKKDAIERLEILVRGYSDRPEPHSALIDLLVETKQWQPAIEAMKVASDAVGDEEFRLQNLARVAEIYEQRLGLPERAIGAWAEIANATDDPDALAKLQDLYLITGRTEDALPIIDRRLAMHDAREDADPKERISILVAKARVLQEGMGNVDAATETLEELLAEAPDDEEVALGLSRLYRRQGRLQDGIELLRQRWEKTDPEDRQQYVKMTDALTRVLDEDGHDPKGALEVVQTALERYPEERSLLEERARLARALHDAPLLAESLSTLGDPDSLLEAADLLRGPVGDSARAIRLYSRVLAEAKKDPDSSQNAGRLAAALEGLVRLRIDDGDIKGAMDFMDRQLAEMKGPTIRAQLLTEMGRITFRSTGDIDAARKRFDDALKEDPDYARAKLGKAEILIDADEIGEAETLLLDAVDVLGLSPSLEDELVEALMLLAKVFESTGRVGEAYRRLTAAARHAPENLEIRAAIVRNRVAAKRYKDAVTAAEHVEQLLSEGIEQTPRRLRLVSDIFVQAATAEKELGHEDKALGRLRRAAELDPGNPDALEPLIALCQERGSLVEAARHAATLARQTSEPALRGQRYIEAGMLHHDAASALADGAEPTGDETEADLRKAAFENLRLGLELVEEAGGTVLDRAQLETAFRASAEHDPMTALRVLDSLLAQRDLPHRFELVLEGVRIGLNADELEIAERHATVARELDPSSAAAVLAQARVLEATDRLDEIEGLVESYFERLGDAKASAEDLRTRVELLLRLAELQEAHPDKAVAAFERASALDPEALGADDRRVLAELYARAGIEDDRSRANHAALLAQEPWNASALRALARHHASHGELDRAYALFTALALFCPDDDEANTFLLGHEISGSGAGELVLDGLVEARPRSAGVPEALELLWDGAHALLSEHLPRLDVPPDARVSPMGESPLAKVWGETLKRLGQTKVALALEDQVTLDADQRPDGAMDVGFFEVRCQHPPVILATDRARDSEDVDALRFALGRALYFTGPEALFATGLRRAALAFLLSATMQAFHPRHSRRKHHQRSDDPVGKFSQELARKLPMRVSRQLTQLFEAHVDEPFETTHWRASIRRGGNRVGLVSCGDLRAALRVLLAHDPPTGEPLSEAVQTDEDLRDLVVFWCSEAFAAARRNLGYEVTAASTT